jgi:hypothetical protein
MHNFSTHAVFLRSRRDFRHVQPSESQSGDRKEGGLSEFKNTIGIQNMDKDDVSVWLPPGCTTLEAGTVSFYSLFRI